MTTDRLDFGDLIREPAWRRSSISDDRRDPNPKRRYRLILAALVAMNGGKVRVPKSLLGEIPVRAKMTAYEEGEAFVLEFSESAVSLPHTQKESP